MIYESIGEHTYFKICNRIFARMPTVKAQRSSSAAAENGLSMNQTIAKRGAVQSIHMQCIDQVQDWKSICAKSIWVVFPNIN
jgi:hypothetical protein